MTGKVQIDIKGVRTIDGQREQVDETGTGEYYKRNGKHYVIGTSEDGAIKRMKFTVDSMSVTGKGGGSMVFEAGKYDWWAVRPGRFMELLRAIWSLSFIPGNFVCVRRMSFWRQR